MKKLTAFILSLLMIATLTAGLAFPTAAVTEGVCGAGGIGVTNDNLTWRYEADTKTLVIEGSGAMKEWRNCRLIPWKEWREEVEHISLPSGLTSIGNYAFFKFKNLKEINIPSTVKTIGNGSFGACEKLTKVEIPYGVTSINGWCFASCTALEEIIFPSSLKTINYECFLNCESLMDVTIPASVTSIQGYAFGYGKSHCYYYDMVLRGVSGSNVESYAKNNMLKFESTNRLATYSAYQEAFTATEADNGSTLDIDGDGIVTAKDMLLAKN